MRFVPLIRSDLDPLPWRRFPALELSWTGSLHPHWRQGPTQIHALHLDSAPWEPALGDRVLELLRLRLDLDFLVIPADCPASRAEKAGFLGLLEGLLEVTQGTGVKLALRPGPGQAPGLARLIKEARGEALGYCWDADLGADLDCLSDRLFCARGQTGDDFRPLQRLGYRWNLAVAGSDPEFLASTLHHLELAFPPVLFPADLGLPPASPHPTLEQP